MKPRFDTVAIIGVGLLGGSLGLALKARGLARYVRGAGRRRTSLDRALEVGAIDTAFLDTGQACTDADLIVVCTPAALVLPKLDEIRAVCPAHAVVTDVASTKSDICAHAARTWPQPRRFVGSHPMAGSEKFGPEHADPGLYDGAVTLLEQAADLAPDAREAVADLWRSLGATVIDVPPARHDALVARSSHVPHVVAACLAQLAVGHEDIGPFLGPGFRDMTRIAAGRPAIWRDICLTNRDALLAGMDDLMARLAEARDLVDGAVPDALDAFFAAGRDARKEALDE